MAAPPQATMQGQAPPSSGGGASAENCQTLLIGEAYNYCCCLCSACADDAPNIVTVRQGHVGVVTTFGQFNGVLPPGRHRINMMADEVRGVSLKVSCIDVPPQDIITADNLALRIDAVVYFIVFDPYRALFAVADYRRAVAELAQVNLRQTLGESTLAELMKDRTKINNRLKQLIDEATDPWGITVSSVELKGVTLDETMQRAMAAKAESKQQAEAKVIQAKAQRHVADILAEASKKMNTSPEALQLQYMETLRIIATQQAPVNRTIIVPADMDAGKALAMASS